MTVVNLALRAAARALVCLLNHRRWWQEQTCMWPERSRTYHCTQCGRWWWR